MATGKDGGGFERDFGYLIPFLDRIEQAGAGLTAPGAREELARLMSGEKARWIRIRELLVGASGGAAQVPGQLAPARSQERAAVKGESAGPLHVHNGLTVGDLKSR